ncbi:MAG: hypothetical protein ACP5NW_03315 [Candidatus Woesearchaeota archaeon]
MVIEDPYDPDEKTMQFKSYVEFKLGKIDEDNLEEIEKIVMNNQTDSSNKKWMSEYLVKLHRKISDIKKEEYSYEGEFNDNVNGYLERIALLKKRIDNTK